MLRKLVRSVRTASRSPSRSRDTSKDGSQDSHGWYTHDSEIESASAPPVPAQNHHTILPLVDSDPYGLVMIRNCDDPQVDIIFVHGLGGASRRTWCRDHDPSFFWPREWLPSDLPHARIHTFGYDADWGSKAESIASITDFAKLLLMGLVVSSEPADFGQCPIIFVAHSMGGLVVKKTYLLAERDPKHQKLANSIYGIVFLGTPHRGSDHAQALKNILKVYRYVSGGSVSKPYVNDLLRSSDTLQNINEEFRHHDSKLKLVSFYETLRTQCGPTHAIMVVERGSAILGYPGEDSAALNADHHNVCKFSSPKDPGYKLIKNALTKLVSESKRCDKTRGQNGPFANEQLEKAYRLLSCRSGDDEDLAAHTNDCHPGSCKWILDREFFKTWRSAPRTHLLWLQGLPGTGKSVLAAFSVQHLKSLYGDHNCQHFFFGSKHGVKSKISSCLRSLAAQVAAGSSLYRRRLANMYDEGVRVGSADARTVWQRLFVGILLGIDFSHPLYWVIDGVDEAEDPRLLVELTGTLCSKSPIKILLLGRPAEVPCSLTSSKLKILIQPLSTDDTSNDVAEYITEALKDLLLDAERRQNIMSTIVTKAAGSFLWVRFALQEVRDVGYTEAGIRAALENVPAGMDTLYQRSLEAMATLHRENQRLAKAIIIWTICSFEDLHLDDLRIALRSQFGEILDLDGAIRRTCPQFIQVDRRRRVQPIHQTAREFLLGSSHPIFGINRKLDHEGIAGVCLTFLSNTGLRLSRHNPAMLHSQLDELGKRPFAAYTARNWSNHLRLASVESEALLDKLLQFLRGSILQWMALIVSFGQLDVLIRAGKDMRAYTERRSKLNTPTTVMRKGDTDLVEAWAVDLVRIATRFGKQVLSSPLSLFTVLPRLCPRRSAMYQQCSSLCGSFQTAGDCGDYWSDCVSRFPLHNDGSVTAIASCDAYLAIGFSNGHITVLSASTFLEQKSFTTPEPVTDLQFSSASAILVAGGGKEVSVWNLHSGKILGAFTASDQVIRVAISASGEEIIAISRNLAVSTWSLLDHKLQDEFRWREPSQGNFSRGFPVATAITSDAHYLAVSYRGHAVSIWDLELQTMVGQVFRGDDRAKGPSTAAQDTVFSMEFNPVTGHLVLSYTDGTLLKWDPQTQERSERDANAHSLTISADGNTIVAGDYLGNIKIWSFSTLELIQHIFTNDDAIEFLTFCPGGLRFYDIRGPYCCAWEPDSLICATKPDDDHSSLGPIHFELTDASIKETPFISALDIDPVGDFICYAKGNLIYIYSLLEAVEKPVLYAHQAGVRVVAIVWSPDRRTIVTADDTRTVIIATAATNESEWTATQSAHITVESAVHQLLFSGNGGWIFIITRNSCEIWNTSGERLANVGITIPIHETVFAPQLEGAGAIYPHDQRIQYIDFDGDTLHFRPTTTELPLSKTYVASNSFWSNETLVLESSPPFYSPGSRRIHLCCLKRPEPVLVKTINEVELLVGRYGNLIVYLDKDYWVCTAQVNSEDDAVGRRHFWLPLEWANGGEMGLHRVTKEGHYVVICNERVAVVYHGLERSLA